MDDGSGQFTEVSREIMEVHLKDPMKKPYEFFEVGEIVYIKKSKFQIKAIGKREVRLRLLPRDIEES